MQITTSLLSTVNLLEKFKNLFKTESSPTTLLGIIILVIIETNLARKIDEKKTFNLQVINMAWHNATS